MSVLGNIFWAVECLSPFFASVERRLNTRACEGGGLS